MPVENIKKCPHCKRSLNPRGISLFDGMVTALLRVWIWCKQVKVHEFTRKDIKHLLKNDNEIARFGDWVYFGGLVYKYGRGKYGINMERADAFFKNKKKIPTTIYKHAITGKVIKRVNLRKAKDIPTLASLLDENQDFIVKYLV